MNSYTSILSISIMAMLLLILCGCPSSSTDKEETPEETRVLAFEAMKIADSLQFLWGHCPADIDNDGIADLVYVDNNARGGTLNYLKGQTEPGHWQKIFLKANTPDGGNFAQGDMEINDIDFDGDMDIIAIDHTGEWDDASAPAKLYWYENPSWTSHYIGEAPDAVKDVSLVDFDKNQKIDIAVLCFETSTLMIFAQKTKDEWEIVQEYTNYKNLHEGMDCGDLDGDGWVDIVANGHAFFNPKGDLTQPWGEATIDDLWNTQTGDWSRNGTKTFAQDINGNGREEVFISHSERSGYPLAYYEYQVDRSWKKEVISDSIAACHTLQVFDFDLDGDYDVLAGVNRSRAVNLGKTSYPVTIFKNEGGAWSPMVLTTDGVYNGQAIDLEGDGDMDIFRYPTHDASNFFVLKNTVR